MQALCCGSATAVPGQQGGKAGKAGSRKRSAPVGGSGTGRLQDRWCQTVLPSIMQHLLACFRALAGWDGHSSSSSSSYSGAAGTRGLKCNTRHDTTSDRVSVRSACMRAHMQLMCNVHR